MAIVKYNGGGLARQPGVKHPAKAAKGAVAKHAAKKHALKQAAKHAEKHAAKKYAKKAAKHTGSKDAAPHLRKSEDGLDLASAFHHLQRAAALISLLEGDSGGDLRRLMEDGVALYNQASSNRSAATARSAAGLLRAAEHLGMAGLYLARSAFRLQVEPAGHSRVAHLLDQLGPRLAAAGSGADGRRLAELGRELLRGALAAGEDTHLEFELAMAAEGICTALEAGI